MDFPGGSETDSACNAEDLGSIPGLGRSPGGGMSNHSSILPGESSWIGKPVDREAWQATVHGVTKSQI